MIEKKKCLFCKKEILVVPGDFFVAITFVRYFNNVFSNNVILVSIYFFFKFFYEVKINCPNIALKRKSL